MPICICFSHILVQQCVVSSTALYKMNGAPGGCLIIVIRCPKLTAIRDMKNTQKDGNHAIYQINRIVMDKSFSRASSSIFWFLEVRRTRDQSKKVKTTSILNTKDNSKIKIEMKLYFG